MDDDTILTGEEARALRERATKGDWYVADGCSWRRILQRYTDAPVIVPTNHWRDNHPDLSAEYPDLELAAAAPRLARTVEHLHAELDAEKERADRLARALAVERGDESAAPEGWGSVVEGEGEDMYWRRAYSVGVRAIAQKVGKQWERALFVGGACDSRLFDSALEAIEDADAVRRTLGNEE